MWLLSRLDQHSTTLETSAAMLVLGVGIGLSMQVLTIIVQNTVEYRDLGVATSGVTFFRTMGSSFGAAVFGTMYANQLAPNLAKAVAATGADPTQVTARPRSRPFRRFSSTRSSRRTPTPSRTCSRRRSRWP